MLANTFACPSITTCFKIEECRVCRKTKVPAGTQKCPMTRRRGVLVKNKITC